MQNLWDPTVIVAGPNPDAESDPAGTPVRPAPEPQLAVAPVQPPPPMGSKARNELRRAELARREGRAP